MRDKSKWSKGVGEFALLEGVVTLSIKIAKMILDKMPQSNYKDIFVQITT